MPRMIHGVRAVVVAAFGSALALTTQSAHARPFIREKITPSPAVSSYPPVGLSLAFGSDGTPHGVFYNKGAGTLSYCTKPGSSWQVEIIDTCGVVFEYVLPGQEFAARSNASIGVDPSGAVHVVYYASNGKDLKYATRSGGTWTKSYIDSTGNKGAFNSMAIDASGNLHVSYHDDTNETLKYIKKTAGGSWSSPVALTADLEEGGYFTSIGLDPMGTVFISHQDEATGILWLAVRHPSSATLTVGWEHQPIDTIVNGGGAAYPSYSSVAVTASGSPHIAYTDPPNGRLELARRSGPYQSEFVVETIPTTRQIAGYVYNYPNAKYDSRGRLHLDLSYDYAMLDENGWHFDMDVSDGSGGGHHGFALDRQGNPAILFGYHDAYRFVIYQYGGVRQVAPAGGETWMVGSLEDVSWFGAGQVKVELSTDGGLTFGTVIPAVETSPATIRVPRANTEHAVLRVTREDPIAWAVSDSFFTIDSTVTLLTFTGQQDQLESGTVLEWQTVPDATKLAGYRIERWNGAGWSIVSPLVTGMTARDPLGKPGDRYRLIAVNGLGGESFLGEANWNGGPAARLAAWPLPFRTGSMTIAFSVPAGAERWNVSIFDIRGRRVREVVNHALPAGPHQVSWDGRDAADRPVDGGVYFLVAGGGSTREVRKLLVLGKD